MEANLNAMDLFLDGLHIRQRCKQGWLQIEASRSQVQVPLSVADGVLLGSQLPSQSQPLTLVTAYSKYVTQVPSSSSSWVVRGLYIHVMVPTLLSA